jgi:hypothetical protein
MHDAMLPQVWYDPVAYELLQVRDVVIFHFTACRLPYKARASHPADLCSPMGPSTIMTPWLLLAVDLAGRAAAGRRRSIRT